MKTQGPSGFDLLKAQGSTFDFLCPLALKLSRLCVVSDQRWDGGMKQRFAGEQLIQMIKKQEAGEKSADGCRRHEISQGTSHK